MQQNVKNILLHILFWTTMFIVPYYFFDDGSEKVTIINTKPPLQFFLLVTPLVISVFYLNAYVFVPRFFIQKRYEYFAICIGITLALSSFLVNLFIQKFIPELLVLPNKRGVFPFVIVLITSTAYSLFLEGNKKEKRLQSLENEQLSTDLKLLRAQINPHFLFNTLNSIYTLALKNSEQTPNAVMQLSNMMRYVTTEAHEEFVSLEKELQYIRHFIDLQRLRLPKNITLNVQYLCQTESKEIAPLLLIPFIENAFKYGVSTRENAVIFIQVKCNENELELKVENRKFQSQNETKDKSGIGLENTKQRLELIYPNRYKLIINDLEDKYEVKLKLDLSPPRPSRREGEPT